MSLLFEQEINFVWDWLRRVNSMLGEGRQPIVFSKQTCDQICANLEIIANGIGYEYPFYADELLTLKTRMFLFPMYSDALIVLNKAVFGEIFIVIKHIIYEPKNERFWQDIHHAVATVSKPLFRDRHYAAASESAIKEVEVQMRELFKKYKPDAIEPKDATGLIGALLSENGLHQFCDTSDKSGQNYRKGIQLIFEGAFSAYRNPTMHANLPCTYEEAFKRITLASLMMQVILGETKK